MQAIDVHMHVPRQPGLPERPVDAQLRQYFRSPPPPTVEDMANKYKELDILGVIFSVDTETTTGDLPDSNDYVAGYRAGLPGAVHRFLQCGPVEGRDRCQRGGALCAGLGDEGAQTAPCTSTVLPQ